MKILKEGKKPLPLKLTCRHCEAELLLEPGDSVRVMQGDGSYPSQYYFKCPCCEESIYIDRKDVHELKLNVKRY